MTESTANIAHDDSGESDKSPASSGTLQPNPANAAEETGWPDWNSKHGTGVAPQGEKQSFEDIYQSAKDGNEARQADKKPDDPGLA